MKELLSVFDKRMAMGHCPTCDKSSLLIMYVVRVLDNDFLYVQCLDCSSILAMLKSSPFTQPPFTTNEPSKTQKSTK